VETGAFPGEGFSPYKMLKTESDQVRQLLLAELSRLRSQTPSPTGEQVATTPVQSAIFQPLRYSNFFPPDTTAIPPATAPDNKPDKSAPGSDPDPPIKVY